MADELVVDVPYQLAAPVGGAVEMFERLARDPAVSVENLERMMALWERAEARKAEAAFNSAMAAAQKEMRPVAADARNEQTRSRYASYEALDAALRPIYTDHGFALSFDTGDSPGPEQVRILCYATHAAGHARTYKIDMPSDGKGAKGGDVMTKTHATGSAVSYGMRYLLKMIFNVAVGEDDDDGNQAAQQRPAAPEGYEAWWSVLEGVAANGFKALDEAWGKTKNAEWKNWTVRHNGDRWKELRAKASAVKA